MSHFQIENEYGSYFACDSGYMRLLYQKTRTILGDNVIIYTTDGDGDHYLKCGTTLGAYATVDFGITGMYRITQFELQIEIESFASPFCPAVLVMSLGPPSVKVKHGLYPRSWNVTT